MSRVLQISPARAMGLLLAWTALLYGRVAGFEAINWDDGQYLFEDAHIIAGWSWEGVVHAVTVADPFLMPLVRLSFLAEYSLLGAEPGHFHLVNLMIHLANVGLLYRLVAVMTGHPWWGVMAAGILALHPQHVEAVAWIAERKEVMAAFFGLWSLWWYGVHVRCLQPSQPPNRQARDAMAWSLLAFLASLLCKPMWVTMPFLLLLLDFWPLARWEQGVGPLLREKIGFWLLTGLFVLLTLVTFGEEGAITDLATISWEQRWTKMVLALAAYGWKTVWPAGLTIYHPYPGQVAAGVMPTLALAWLAMTSWLVWQRRRWAGLLMGWLWFFGTLVPVAGLVEGGMPIGLADRWSYLPHIGLAWAVGCLPMKPAKVLGLLAAGVWSLLTWQQVTTWQNSQSVWQQAIEVYPDDGFPYWKQGSDHLQQGRLAAAEARFTAALQRKPADPDFALAHWQSLVALDRQQEAAQVLRQLHATHAHALAPLVRAGEILLRGGYYAPAAAFFQAALAANGAAGRQGELQFFLALTLFASQQVTEGERLLTHLLADQQAEFRARCQLATGFFQNPVNRRPAFDTMRTAIQQRCG